MVNFTNDDFSKGLASELDNLNMQLEYQKAQKKTLIMWANTLTEEIDSYEENTDVRDLLTVIENLKTNLENINVNIEELTSLVSGLQRIVFNIDNGINIEKINNDLNVYNSISTDTLKQIYNNNLKIEVFVQNLYSQTNISKPSSLQKNKTTAITSKDANTKIAPVTEDSNTLLISEITGHVELPYKIANLERLLFHNKRKYSDITDLVKDQYILPLSKYKNTTVARFRESYNLMKIKEQESFLKALELAFELMFKYTLHPAIISACDGLDELDVYLDCLEENELDKFKLFEIKYEILPTKR